MKGRKGGKSSFYTPMTTLILARTWTSHRAASGCFAVKRINCHRPITIHDNAGFPCIKAGDAFGRAQVFVLRWWSRSVASHQAFFGLEAVIMTLTGDLQFTCRQKWLRGCGQFTIPGACQEWKHIIGPSKELRLLGGPVHAGGVGQAKD